MRHVHGNADELPAQDCVSGVLSLRSAAWPLGARTVRETERTLLRSVQDVERKEGWSMFDKNGAILKMILAFN
jgi:hypothetical protein